MTIYADTSALVKLYVEEPGSDYMEKLTEQGDILTSSLAYAEAHASFARRHRESLLTGAECSSLRQQFDEDWGVLLGEVQLDGAVQACVADLCHQHPLRGADAVHLASAVALRSAGVEVTFVGSDGRLLKAARKEGLKAIDPAAPDVDSE